MTGDPQSPIEARAAARHLMHRPLTCAEHDPDVFRLIRRHATTLDRWFTQRFGDRVHVDADTARLYKSVAPPPGRPLRTSTGRALRQVEYVMLSLAFAAVASGPDVISLRDLVAAVRSAAAEADVDLAGDATERRALVAALQWMIAQGLLFELHDHVERYTADDQADAILRVRADRVALVALPVLGDAIDGDDLIERARERGTPRQQMRARLANDPVLYRSDLSPDHWSELRRRLGEESAILDEVLGLELEARAEGIAAIDPSGALSDRRFPSGGTESHAALLLIDRLVELRSTTEWDDSTGDDGDIEHADIDDRDGPSQDHADGWIPRTQIVEMVRELALPHVRRWRSELVEHPDRLADSVVDLLVDLRLADRGGHPDGSWHVRLLPAAARFTTAEVADGPDDAADGASGERPPADQQSLW